MKKCLIVFFFFVGLRCTYAQTVESNRVLPPSPTAASLGKYGDYPVSLYTGQVDISIPIYTVNSGKLSLPVSLSYNGSGHRPSDIPGWVGLGWSLNSGGVIARTIQDLPDDANGGDVGVGFYYGGAELKTQYDKLAGPDDNYRIEHLDRRVDFKPDVFSFNFNGISGRFSFDHTGKIQFYGREKFKIEFSIGATDYFESFTITTNDGVKYSFSQQEWGFSKIGKSGQEIAYISSWYLTNIENASGDNIQLNYAYNINSIRVKESSFEKFLYGVVYSPPYTPEVDVNEVSKNTSADEVIYLSEILFENGKLSFNTTPRHDIRYRPSSYSSSYGDEKKLDELTLKNDLNESLKSWKFNYIDLPNQRLKLESLIQRNSVNQEQKLASFIYNPLLLPYLGEGNSSNSFDSMDTDYWGYFNNAGNTQGRIPLVNLPNGVVRGTAVRTCNEVAMKAEILQKIIYPTGGSTSFEFEPHTYGMSVGTYFDPFEFVWSAPVDFHYESGQFYEDPEYITFTLTEKSLVETQTHCQAIYGPSSIWCTFNQQKKFTEMEAGTYTLRDIFNTDLLKSRESMDIDIADGYVKIRTKVPVKKRMAGGLRIKSVTNSDGLNNYTKNYKYEYDDDPDGSTGVLSKFPVNHARLEDYWYNVTGIWLSSESIEPIPEGPNVGYAMVTEILENGSKIQHYYNTYRDYYDVEGTLFTDLSGHMAALISNNFWRGLETKTEYLNANNLKIKEVTNTYLEEPNTKYDIPALEDKYGFSTNPEGGAGGGLVSVTIPSKYAIWCRFIYKKSSLEKTYDINGLNPISVLTNYHYDNPKHLQPTRIVKQRSNGKEFTSLTTYPDDYLLGTVFLDQMKENHQIALPIEQVQYQNAGSNYEILNGQIIRYKKGGKGLIDTTYVLESSEPIVSLNFKFSGTVFGKLPKESVISEYLPDNRYKPKMSYEYDVRGSVIQEKKIGGVSRSYLWAYNNAYPIAAIDNADYKKIESILGETAIAAFRTSKPNSTEINTFLSILKTALPDVMILQYSYVPLVGLISSTDAKGQVTYYEYDSFQRLKRVKDHDHNVIKNYDYYYRL